MRYKPSFADKFWKIVNAPFKEMKDLEVDFHYAATTNMLWRAEYLLTEKGVDIASGNNFAVRWAANGGHDDMLRLLFRHGGIDVNAKEGDALIRAVTRGHTSTVGLLLEHGADIAQQEYKALHLAHEKNNISLLAQLVTSGQDLRETIAALHADAVEKNDESPAHQARLKLYGDYLAQQIPPRKPPNAPRL
ncbi:MAG TPA: ankyrin repeat domain-containing protein [Alphaproteobacteria bacterium]|jgi:ankyrin repeat protein|nr:ankyrin repeat domain-containing protein [Alphaproteobacteria bacterium]